MGNQLISTRQFARDFYCKLSPSPSLSPSPPSLFGNPVILFLFGNIAQIKLVCGCGYGCGCGWDCKCLIMLDFAFYYIRLSFKIFTVLIISLRFFGECEHQPINYLYCANVLAERQRTQKQANFNIEQKTQKY